MKTTVARLQFADLPKRQWAVGTGILGLVFAPWVCWTAADAPQSPITVTNPAFPEWRASAGQTNAQFSISAASAGDVNGDGYSDIIIGAPKFTQSLIEEGAAFVYYGSESGLSARPNWAAYGAESYADFGSSVASAGDVNRDGFDDVVVGSFSYTFRSGEYNVGAAFVYLGSASGLASTPVWTAEGPHPTSHFGYCVAGAGDVNGDGLPDLIVGAPNFAEAGQAVGKAFVFHGSTQSFAAKADWTFNGELAGARFGQLVAAAGDVNGDGFADVIVATRDQTVNGMEAAGKVYVFHGSGEGLSRRPAWTFEGIHALARLGVNCGTAGDVNGDGFSDVIVGAFGMSRGQEREGAAYVFHGSPHGLGRPNWFVESNKSGAGLGQGVGSAGDVNGDGFADVIIGAPTYKGKSGPEGRAFIFHGSVEGLETNAAWTATLQHYRAAFGRTTVTAGDVNGDGFADVLVGALMERHDASGGQVAVFHGSKDGVLRAGPEPASERMVAQRLRPPLPPLWKRNWFLGVTTLGFTGLAAALWHITTTARLKRQLRRAEQQRTVEQERLRISQDLHDQLGANLTTIALLSDVARRDQGLSHEADAHIRKISGTARDLTRALEEIVWAVNPHKDRLDQMVSYFSAHAEEFFKPTEIRCRLDFPEELPDLPISTEIRHQLFLVFKEALTNVVRHAAAGEVRIGLQLDGSCLRVSIEDDGCGFDPRVSPSGRDGLGNMRARIEKLGGFCQISSRLGQGTRIVVEVPISSTNAAG